MSTQQLSILIADDDLGDRMQIRRALNGANFKCVITEVENMGTAIEACEQGSFDCAILDYLMPGSDGLEGVSNLHEKYPYMPILMATGQGDEMVASEAFKRGALDYIIKRNISAPSIQRVVRNVVEKTNLQQKVDEQRQALENFARMLVHDLSAPINLMRGFSGLIAAAVENEKYDGLQGYCDRMEISGKRMQELIDTLNEYNKVSGGDVSFEAVPLEKALRRAVENLSIIIQEKNAKITFDEMPMVIGNVPQLAQLFQNLIGNALKYCESEIPEVHIGAEFREDRWRISIKDNGIGIPAKFSKEIFSPFKRLHSQKDKKYSGTGLGLATCKNIVQRHDGKIWCKSETGEGAIFYFTLTAKD